MCSLQSSYQAEALSDVQVEIVDKSGRTALHTAAVYGRGDVCARIMGTDMGEHCLLLQDEDGNTPLHLAAINNQVVAPHYPCNDHLTGDNFTGRCS